MIENKIQLILSSGEYLDVDYDLGVPINLVVDDLKNPESKNTTYSKTTYLKGTKNNNKLLGQLYSINATYDYFNPNFRTGVKLITNGVTVLDGFMQLININKTFNPDLEGSEITYEVVLFDSVNNLFKEIGESLLSDLDYSELNHTFDYSTVSGSWSNTWEGGYIYPLMYKGSNDYNIEDFKAGVFHKYYLRKILQNAGYEVDGSMYENNDYEKEVIPFVGDFGNVTKQYATDYSLELGYSTGKTFTNLNNVGIQYFKDPKTYSLNHTLAINDPQSAYDNGTYQWTVPVNSTFNLEGRFNGTITFDSDGLDAWFNSFNTYSQGVSVNAVADSTLLVKVMLVRYVPSSGQRYQMGESLVAEITLPNNVSGESVNYNWLPAFYSGNSWTRTIEFDIRGSFGNVFIPSGYTMEFDFSLELTNDAAFYRSAYSNGITTTERTLDITVATNDYTLNYVKATPDKAKIYLDTPIQFNYHIPPTIKQKDLLNDIIGRYNLFITVNPNNTRKLTFETRDEYYFDGEQLDWTDLKDYSVDDKIEFLSELQEKEVKFTYTNDDTEALKHYTDSTGDVYGEKVIEYDNEFTTGEKIIGTPFSPTALVYNTSDYYSACIVPDINMNNSNVKPRVLYYGGMMDCISGNTWWFNYANDGVEYSTYPYFGHFDDPYNPNIDINFGDQNFYYYNELNQLTTNNLYNRFWKNTIEQIADGRVVTSRFKLNEVIISKLRQKLNKKIWVKDANYIINRISDYDPTRPYETTEVELLKLRPFTPFVSSTDDVRQPLNKQSIITKPVFPTSIEAQATPVVTTTTTFPESIEATPQVTLTTTTTGGGSSSALKTSQINLIQSSQVAVVGTNNIVGANAESVMIVGDNNFIDQAVTNSGVIGGSGNFFKAGITNSWVIGKDKVFVDKSNITYVGNLKLDSNTGVVIPSYNRIIGGYDELRNPFSSNPENMIVGGNDELRNTFATSVTNRIKG